MRANSSHISPSTATVNRLLQSTDFFDDPEQNETNRAGVCSIEERDNPPWRAKAIEEIAFAHPARHGEGRK